MTMATKKQVSELLRKLELKIEEFYSLQIDKPNKGVFSEVVTMNENLRRAELMIMRYTLAWVLEPHLYEAEAFITDNFKHNNLVPYIDED